MATRADDLIDRRRLRRKLTFWRVAAVVVLVIALVVGSSALMGDGPWTPASGAHVARISVEGTIVEDEELLERIERVRKSDAVKGVILTVDSPGGTTVGGEAIFEAVRALAEEKPVVAQVGTLAASAGYMIASAADHIVARQSSIVGSIGVLVQFPDVTGLMDKIGVELVEIKSSPLKAEPSPFNETTPAERAMMRAMILDSYDWFVDLVTDRRPLSRDEVLALADGSIFTGRQAAERRLVDALGGEKTARAWLTEQGVDADLKVVEWKPRDRGGVTLVPGFLAAAAARLLGLPQDGPQLLRALGAERIFLDGLLSVWQPENGGEID
ncbi:signal peptide peptidase SppA [Aquibium sp. A9E412]|uniref:signal peptide peptidase SppA n=1 Tax=Aquibium sp. A9E412 TaxID=2976767 RepID=UPI0025AFA3F4|nr:signal peptide peptidase SppA [Aquibium sp. A9E412]MDN2568139.1 signal peptide peptidase SppA [Aquibium sp. A9E412]